MLIHDLQSKLVGYQKEKDTLRLEVLRFLLSAIQNKEIELRPSGQVLTDELVRKVIEKQIKQHKDSIDLYTKGNRQDLADKEQAQLKVLEEFLTY